MPRKTMPKDATITLSLKDVLNQVNRKLDGIVESLGTKAESSLVTLLTDRIFALERGSATRDAVEDKLDKYRKWILATTIGLVMALCAVAGLIAKYH